MAKLALPLVGVDRLNASAGENAKATEANTRAIEKLSGELRSFHDQTQQQLNSQDGRIIRLEERSGTRRRAPVDG